MPGLVNYIRVYRRCRRRIIIFAIHGAGVQCARPATELDRPHTTKAPATDLTRMALYKTIWRCQSPFILSLSLTLCLPHQNDNISLQFSSAVRTPFGSEIGNTAWALLSSRFCSPIEKRDEFFIQSFNFKFFAIFVVARCCCAPSNSRIAILNWNSKYFLLLHSHS